MRHAFSDADRSASLDRAYDDAKRHLSALKAEVDADSRPCRSCRHGGPTNYSFQMKCRNPIVQRGLYDADRGKISWVSPDWRQMRQASGGCGPEGRLFEKAALPVRFWRRVPEPLQWALGAAACAAAPFVMFFIAVKVR